MWLGAGSAVAAMVAAAWYYLARHGPGGDMDGHSAAAKWLRTLPWWDWRGWSDWFYGGQALGVNYPPLGHAWMRFTDPEHGQMAAVALGLLVLLPWGVLRLARAIGATPQEQRAAVGAALVLVAASAQMHWILSGFHIMSTFFSSWPAMVAWVLGLHAASWAARCARPVACGAVAGAALLFNPTVMPGVAAVSAVLVATSDTPPGRALRWTATAGSTALAVCAWWLVPFLAGWERLVRFEVKLSQAWLAGGYWQVAVLTFVAAAAMWAARSTGGAARRLALCAGAGLLATTMGDLLGYLRPERWLGLAVLMAAMAAGFLTTRAGLWSPPRLRPAWSLMGVAVTLVVAVVTVRVELLPVAAWLMWGSRQAWSWSTALAWTAVAMSVPFLALVTAPRLLEPLEAVARAADPESEGLVHMDYVYRRPDGNLERCPAEQPLQISADTGGRIRPLLGLYQETSAAGEFLHTGRILRAAPSGNRPLGSRPHWQDAWQAAGTTPLDARLHAEALGARWLGECEPDGTVTVTELPGVMAVGVAVAPHPTTEVWHRQATRWWVSLDHDALGRIPILSDAEPDAYPADRAASVLRLSRHDDRMVVHADEAGWVWLRVPWDPWWHNHGGGPVRKGGPGHLVVWVERGSTELRWAVPGVVDAAAAAVSAVALGSTLMLGVAWRRHRAPPVPDRTRPAVDAVNVFADTVDEWVAAAASAVRRVAARLRRSHEHRQQAE